MVVVEKKKKKAWTTSNNLRNIMRLFIRLFMALVCKSFFLTTLWVYWHWGIWAVIRSAVWVLKPVYVNDLFAMLLFSTAPNWLQSLDLYWACDRENLLISRDSRHIWSYCTTLNQLDFPLYFLSRNLAVLSPLLSGEELGIVSWLAC